ncbi:MAG: nitrous oxide reductase family maturation protein NosD, partial [Promethearchaeota archaeon]
LFNNQINLNDGYNDNSLENNNKINLNNGNLRNSKISGHIHIDDTNPDRNWSVAKDLDICTGNGTYSEPYVIEDYVIDGGSVGSCIWIENSNVYFRIENCSLTNSAELLSQAGIKLENVNNSQLINNNCSFNDNGIRADYSYNTTILGNMVPNNKRNGIILYRCNNSIISSNIADNNNVEGIRIHNCKYNNITRNNITYNSGYGIAILYSDNNTITGNIAVTNNRINTVGIYLCYSDYNTISGNRLIGNGKCIWEDNCHGNFFDNNNCINYNRGDEVILVCYIILSLIIVSFIAVIIVIHKKLISRNF